MSKPYRVRPYRLSAFTTSKAVTAFRRACSVWVTASRTTVSRNSLLANLGACRQVMEPRPREGRESRHLLSSQC